MAALLKLPTFYCNILSSLFVFVSISGQLTVLLPTAHSSFIPRDSSKYDEQRPRQGASSEPVWLWQRVKAWSSALFSLQLQDAGASLVWDRGEAVQVSAYEVLRGCAVLHELIFSKLQSLTALLTGS